MIQKYKYLYLGLFAFFLLGIIGCISNRKSTNNDSSTISDGNEPHAKKHDLNPSKATSMSKKNENHTDYEIPDGFIIIEKKYGDLNGDGLDDSLVVVRDTNKENIIQDEDHGEINTNRYGIAIYFNKKGENELVSQNLHCFPAGSDAGRFSISPKLSLKIHNGNLYIHHDHGRYGYWEHVFKYINSDFELIRYELSENYGPVVNRRTIIDYLTKKKLVQENMNKDATESGNELFKEQLEDIDMDQRIKLSAIKDFESRKMFL
ncbi:hypothetical protein HME9304_03105 [Flagellimonas maritima]|uniref:Uncharacterized protein n=1 Tax=Flagellimonas maritima TaxID=1383885 RepID=A0A2Z4LWL4_9FLAO|nr:hypothetical protein [Allomuricauda aurantiaca]AWX46073.1 hypothetical protein HME9304_03105 [Allomuricauda aurantiaca]